MKKIFTLMFLFITLIFTFYGCEEKKKEEVKVETKEENDVLKF